MTQFTPTTNADKTAINRNRQINQMRDEVERLSPVDVRLFDAISSAFNVCFRFALGIIVNHVKMKAEIKQLRREITELKTKPAPQKNYS